MKALFIGGTGTISMAITRQLAQQWPDWELYLINRGNRNDAVPAQVKQIVVDINDEAAVAEKIASLHFDCVCDFIGFVPIDHIVPMAVARRAPAITLEPAGSFATAINKTADRVLAYEYGFNENLSIDDADLELLKSEYSPVEQQ